MDHILLTELNEARRSYGRSEASLAAMLDVKPQMIKLLEAGMGSVSMLVEAMAALDFELIGIGPGRTLGDQLPSIRQKALCLETGAQLTRLLRVTIASLRYRRGSVRSWLRLLGSIAPAARRHALERTYWGAGDTFDRNSDLRCPASTRGFTGPIGG